jgi:hypothetical protein
VLIILAISVILCVLTTAVTAWIVRGYGGDHLTWWTSAGSRYFHHTVESEIATSDAPVFAMRQTLPPVVLAAVSLVALRLPRVRASVWATTPAWIGAYFMTGIAVGVIADFYGSVTGQDQSDFLPAVAMIAPVGLPLFAFFTVAPLLILINRRRDRPRSTT